MAALLETCAVGAENAQVILARMREASGSEVLAGNKGHVLIKGKSKQYEAPGSYTLRFTAAGQYLQKTDSPLGDTHGFNGKGGWMVDRNGISRTEAFFDLDLRQLWVGFQTGLWLAHADPAQIELAAEGSDASTVVLGLHQGRMKARLFVDRATWLPRMLKRTGVTGQQQWTFSDYRNDLGWKVPGKVLMETSAGITNSCEVQSVTEADADPQAYDPVVSRPKDVRFDSSRSARLEVKRARTGHVLVRPKIDGVDLGWFIFDTGAGAATVVDKTAAAKLKLTPVGATPLTSIFGSVRSSIMRGASLEIGPMTITKPFLAEMDLSFIGKAMGEQLAGIIGYDLLSRSVTEISLSDDSVQVFEPASYRLKEGAWQKLRFNQWLPLVPATFDGGEGLFRIDVGASGGAFSNVTFHSPAVERLHLLKDRQVTKGKVASMDVAYGKLGWFELAGHRFEKPEVVFALDRKGPLGDEYVEGNLGVSFLKPFRIVLDFPHERVALVALERSKK